MIRFRQVQIILSLTLRRRTIDRVVFLPLLFLVTLDHRLISDRAAVNLITIITRCDLAILATALLAIKPLVLRISEVVKFE